MKPLSWRALLTVVICSVSPLQADAIKAPLSTFNSPLLDGLEPRYKNTRTITGIPRGLIAWWTGDANALDSLGQNNGRAHGNVTYVPGMVGQAFHLAGEKSYIKAATTDLDPGSGAGLSLDMWIKPDDLSKLQPVAGWAGSTTPGVSLWLEPATDGGKAKFGADLRDTKGNTHRLLSQQAVITANQWQHILLEYRRGSGVVSLYWNGKVQAERNVGQLEAQTKLDFYIGRHAYINGGNTTFQGAIDEVSVTSRALDLSEIQGIFRAGSAGKQLISEKSATLTDEQRRISLDKRLASFVAKHKGQGFSLAIYVDGSDFLHIQGDKVWLVHGGWQLPGGNQSTRINGVEWPLTWNDNVSDKYTLTNPLPQTGEPALAIDILNDGDIPPQSDAKFNIRITQEPTPDNNYEAVLFLDDGDASGAHWFVFTVGWDEQK